MGEISTRTIGPEDIVPEELTVEEAIALGAADLPTAEVIDLDAVKETSEVDPHVEASYFKSEPYIALRAVTTTGYIDALLTLQEARLIAGSLGEALGAAEQG